MAFGGTRTADLLSIAIRLAGFERFDEISYHHTVLPGRIDWVQGSGFPKNCDISKAIDREAGAEREVIGRKPGLHSRGNIDLPDGWHRPWMDDPEKRNLAEMETAPATDAARTWAGYGTSLKPSHEPILLFRKPRTGTYAQTAVAHGTGCLNIDGTRIKPTNGETLQRPERRGLGVSGGWANYSQEPGMYGTPDGQGRWPSNCIFDRAAADLLDEMSGELTSGKLKPGHQRNGSKSWFTGDRMDETYGDTGGASRFFAVLPTFIYQAKAATSERNQGIEDLITWENTDLNQEMECLRQLLNGISDDTMWQLNAYEWNTALSGSNITGQSLTAIKSTIRIVIKLITDLKTLNSLTLQLIKDCTLAAIKQAMADGLNLAESAENTNQWIANTINKEDTASAPGVVVAALKTLSAISAQGRRGNIHSTVKPVTLTEYLARLIVPPKEYRADARLLVPFAGSGSEMIGALLAGWLNVDGIELDEGYIEIARQRLEHWRDELSTEPRQINGRTTDYDAMPLFAELAA